LILSIIIYFEDKNNGKVLNSVAVDEVLDDEEAKKLIE
jgi:hypothetical protein